VIARGRLWRAGSVVVLVLLAAPWWSGVRIAGPTLADALRCPLGGAAFAQDGAGTGLSIDVTNIFGDGCFELRIVGACPCAEPPYVCVQIEYWEPRLLIVTEQAQADKAHGQLGQQFGEVTAYPFPVGAVMELLGFDFLCTPDDLRSQTTLSAAASYSSRLDEVPWRTGGLETVLAEATAPGATALSVGCALDSLVSVPYLGGLCMGVWGPLFARAGWLIHGSQPVGSGAVAYRAAHIISWPELLWGRVAVPAFDFRATTSDKMNLVAPTLMGCIRPGTHPLGWESARLSSTGQYAWVYWVKRTCCVQL
jgi:TraU protein